MITFDRDPASYQHWRLTFDGPVATLALDVNEDGGIDEGYKLKLNSYDLGVDIELRDALDRIRFEHPEVRTVVSHTGRAEVSTDPMGFELMLKAVLVSLLGHGG